MNSTHKGTAASGLSPLAERPGAEAQAKQETHLGTVEPPDDRRSSSRLRRRDMTAVRSAGSSINTLRSALPTLSSTRPSTGASMRPRRNPALMGRGRTKRRGGRQIRASARRSRWSRSRPTPERQSSHRPSSTPFCDTGSTSGRRRTRGGSRQLRGERVPLRCGRLVIALSTPGLTLPARMT